MRHSRHIAVPARSRYTTSLALRVGGCLLAAAAAFFSAAFAESQLEITCLPLESAGVELFLNGEFIGECPRLEVARVSAGTHTLTAYADLLDGSYVTFERVFRLADSVTMSITVELELVRTEEYYWQRARASMRVTDFQELLRRFPNGRYAQQALELIENLWYEGIRSIDDLERFLEQYPNGRYSEEARARLEEAHYLNADTVPGAMEYLTIYPSGRYASEVGAWLEETLYQACENDQAACRAYQEWFPEGRLQDDRRFEDFRATAYTFRQDLCSRCLYIQATFSPEGDSVYLSNPMSQWEKYELHGSGSRDLSAELQEDLGLIKTSLSFSPDGRWMLTTDDPFSTVAVVQDRASGEPMFNIAGSSPHNAIASAEFSSDGKTLFVGFSYGQVKALRVPSGDEVWATQVGYGADELRGWTNKVRVALLPDEAALLASNEQGAIVLLDAQTGELGMTLHEQCDPFETRQQCRAPTQAFALDNDRVAGIFPEASQGPELLHGGSLKVWSRWTGLSVAEMRIEGINGSVSAHPTLPLLAWSRALNGQSGEFVFWDYDRMQVVGTIPISDFYPGRIFFGPTGDRFVYVSGYNTELWTIEQNQ